MMQVSCVKILQLIRRHTDRKHREEISKGWRGNCLLLHDDSS